MFSLFSVTFDIYVFNWLQLYPQFTAVGSRPRIGRCSHVIVTFAIKSFKALLLWIWLVPCGTGLFTRLISFICIVRCGIWGSSYETDVNLVM